MPVASIVSNLSTLAMLLALGGCASRAAAPPVQQPHGHADVLLSSDRGFRSIAFDARHTYLSVSNDALHASSVQRSAPIVNRASSWEQVDLGPCRLGPVQPGAAVRAPALARLAGGIYLFQPTFNGEEHSLCKLERAFEWFQPRDDGLRACRDRHCDRLWMTDLQLHDGRLLSNAGGGQNVLSAAGDWAGWEPLLGSVKAHDCPHAVFRVVGSRLLSGTSCSGISGLRAYRMGAAGSSEPAALTLPPLEGRQMHLIASPAAPTVFVGLDGALLKSDDGGASFRYVILHPAGTRVQPAISSLLALRERPQVLVAAGGDAGTGAPYLAVSRDGGERWTDLSSMLPGHAEARAAAPAQVTALVQDRAGRVLLTLNLQPGAQGRLLMLTLRGLD